jgi:LysM repeat protein
MELKSELKLLIGFWIGIFAANTVQAKIHIVSKGESLSLIAAKYGVSRASIISSNNITNPNLLRIGKRLTIPQSGQSEITYIVKKGDSLGLIAQKHGTSAKALSDFNNISNPSLIKVGQKLKIPSSSDATSSKIEDREETLLSSSIHKDLNTIRVTKSKWKGIVIHHSATDVGSAKALDNFHRNQRRMENGLAYHFVIGNGSGMGDGEIHVGNRWKKQLDGGHLKLEEWNKIYIGICLIGNFEKQTPSTKQMNALEGLTRHLMRRCNLDASKVTTHRIQHKNHTVCPGKNFSISALKNRLK